MHEEHHKEVVDGAAELFAPIMQNSPQGIYIYLDDINKSCNKVFSSMLGYKSPEDWAAVATSFPQAFVAKRSQRVLISAYRDAMDRGVGSSNEIVWMTKGGKEVKTRTILVPLVHDGHALALHFISKV